MTHSHCIAGQIRLKTHSEYVTLNIFHGNDGYTEARKSYFIRTSTVLLNTINVEIRTFHFPRLLYSCYIYTLIMKHVRPERVKRGPNP
jgi:hypothetical protein